jgi:hypothetical protein
VKKTEEPETLFKTTVWVPPALWEQLKKRAGAEYKTTASLLRELLAEGLSKREKRS